MGRASSMTLLLWLCLLSAAPAGHAQTATDAASSKAADADTTCSDGCVPVSCVSAWWKAAGATELVSASVLVFFATFLPRVLVRLVIFVLTKLPFLRQYVFSAC